MLNSAVRLLEQTAASYPGRTAIQDNDISLTYDDYLIQARKVGTGLVNAALNRGPIVIMLPKSSRALVSFMGAMYAGCPYVPMNLSTPTSRLKKMFENLSPAAMIADDAQMEKLHEEFPDIPLFSFSQLLQTQIDEAALENSLDRVVDTDPIYIMYTSGSTGIPKGVTIAHRGVLDYANWVVERFGYSENTVMANQAPLYFDNSIYDIYGCMNCGGKLILTPESLLLFPSKLPAFLAENEVTSIFWVPTVMINVANSGALSSAELPKLKNVSFCGEVMPNLQLNVWRKALPNCTYANLYGPTEISDVCCYYVVDREFADSDPLPIGKACENTRIHLLNESNEEAKVGEQGEICVVGSGVGLGYWNAPELTAKVFVQNPLQKNVPQSIYRTGDLAVRTSEGLILFHGRKDSQIKLRGNRIELGEIESAAMCIEGVENCCAILDESKQQITLFAETTRDMNLRKFNLEMKKYVPNYMLPGQLVCMEKLPHTANDKIDRVRLKASLQEG